MRHAFRILLAFGFISAGSGVSLFAVDQARVQQMVGRAAGHLQGSIKGLGGGPLSLAALALLKADVPANSPDIQRAVDEVRKRVDPVKGYQPDGEHVYSAGIGAVLLSDAGAEVNRPYLEAIAKYIQAVQRPNGSWDYPVRDGTNGDTSVTHYALLGLWACTRAGVEVKPETWVKATQWHIAIQNADGGYAYCPGVTLGDGGAGSTLNMTINAVGSMSIAWLHLSSTPPSLEEAPKKVVAPATAKPRLNSVLEAVPIEVVDTASKTNPAELPDGTLAAMKRAYNWVSVRFRVENTQTSHDTYYYYSLERMTGLVNVSRVGDHDWFAECSDFLASKQQPDGGFGGFRTHSGAATGDAFIILSLVRSTAKLLKRSAKVATFGNGLLQGGRGLPDNLRDGDKPKKDAKPATPLDQLLSSLSKASNFEVEEMQEQLVEQVQIGDRRELIAQKGLLVKLIQHPNAEIRRTAAWALGRTNDLSLARHLITALEDPDVDVNIEAHNALCWISRKPAGFDIQLDPFEGLPLDAGPDIREATLTGWRTAALRAWGDWYLKNRPYKERGDEFEALLREKLASLK
jgi:hypothetical protein